MVNSQTNSIAGLESQCPNCWGQQEYDGKAIDLKEDKQIAVNNSTSRYAFIQDFVVNYVSGIHLKKHTQGYLCTPCQTTFGKEIREISR